MSISVPRRFLLEASTQLSHSWFCTDLLYLRPSVFIRTKTFDLWCAQAVVNSKVNKSAFEQTILVIDLIHFG